WLREPPAWWSRWYGYPIRRKHLRPPPDPYPRPILTVLPRYPPYLTASIGGLPAFCPTSRTLGDTTVWFGKARANCVTFRTAGRVKRRHSGCERRANVGAIPT